LCVILSERTDLARVILSERSNLARVILSERSNLARVILSERSERKDRFPSRRLKLPWMDSDPFVASRLRMTTGLRDSG